MSRVNGERETMIEKQSVLNHRFALITAHRR